jgi:hypothetical protein
MSSTNDCANFLIKRIPYNLQDLRDTDKYNSSNHLLPNGKKPSDYEAKMAECNAKHWIDKFRTDYIKITFDKSDMDILRKCQRVHVLTEYVSEIFRDDIDELAAKYDKRLPVFVPQDNKHDDEKFPGYFVRAGDVSLKYGMHGNIPHKSFKTIIESIISCPLYHTPMNAEFISLYLVPWIEINPDLEFRVFVHNVNVCAISQQHLYRKNNTLNDELAVYYCRMIVDYIFDEVILQIDLQSFCLDICIVDEKPYFIEINPFGAEYSSGSALFHWIVDSDILYGDTGTGMMGVRYVSDLPDPVDEDIDKGDV